VFNMGVAAFVAHGDDPWILEVAVVDGVKYYTVGKEFALLYLIPFLAFAVLGAGKTGIDAALRPSPTKSK
ncbi:MAG: hypothetical protein AAF743_16475, partial [Planctomycetota bacterium]